MSNFAEFNFNSTLYGTVIECSILLYQINHLTTNVYMENGKFQVNRNKRVTKTVAINKIWGEFNKAVTNVDLLFVKFHRKCHVNLPLFQNLKLSIHYKWDFMLSHSTWVDWPWTYKYINKWLDRKNRYYIGKRFFDLKI